MKKHILMIAYTDYRFDARVRREAEALAAHASYAVHVLARRERNQEKNRTYELNGVTVEELPIAKYTGTSLLRFGVAYFWFFFLAFIACTSRFLKHRTDIIHVHNMPDFLVFAAVIPRLFGKKLVLDIHDTVPEHYRSKFETSTSRFVYRLLCLEERISCAFAHRLICVNHVQREVLLKRGISPQKITVLLNVPDNRIFSPQQTHTAIADGESFRLCYHGTLASRLGIDLVLEAMARLAKDGVNVEFHMLGFGTPDYLEGLLRLRRELGLESRVFCNFNGVAIDELPGILAGMHLGVVPMRRNTATDLALPVKMLEYISLGIPVVVPRLTAIEHYFGDGMVCYFEPDDVTSLADALLKLYRDPQRREAQALKAKSFLETYGWEKHQLELTSLYERELTDTERLVNRQREVSGEIR
jgi:glycosyltransferase involved in cell wall biosynthesis